LNSLGAFRDGASRNQRQTGLLRVKILSVSVSTHPFRYRPRTWLKGRKPPISNRSSGLSVPGESTQFHEMIFTETSEAREGVVFFLLLKLHLLCIIRSIHAITRTPAMVPFTFVRGRL
jgi:hypothetical protein